MKHRLVLLLSMAVGSGAAFAQDGGHAGHDHAGHDHAAHGHGGHEAHGSHGGHGAHGGHHGMGHAQVEPLHPIRDGVSAVIDQETRTVKLAAYTQPKRFNQSTHMPGFHCVVPQQGENLEAALFVSFVSKEDFYQALDGFGLESGDNVPMGAMNRDDGHNFDADILAEGSVLDLRVTWDGADKEYPIADLLDIRDESPEASAFKTVFTGNHERRPVVGCLTCLYSCPIGTTSNGSLSQRDYGQNPDRFRAKEDILPADGTEVTLIYRVL